MCNRARNSYEPEALHTYFGTIFSVNRPTDNRFYAAAAHPRRPWWKRYCRTRIIFLVAIGSIALLAAFSFGGRDSSGNAAGQGLASAFEALFSSLAYSSLVGWH